MHPKGVAYRLCDKLLLSFPSHKIEFFSRITLYESDFHESSRSRMILK
ncbi:hypothetical protein RIEGSTA812A_PEG_126 [invertebrate metagenome]|uniref:Uncharacterized protein n=1 Tax=invertebrate metagenome TaxID=1711999 RepID=A0A484H7D5_9ZZZZ